MHRRTLLKHLALGAAASCALTLNRYAIAREAPLRVIAVSYTHLTLPTILLV